MQKEAMFARTLVELADTLGADFDGVDLLSRLAARCVELLDVGAAGLMLAAPDGELRVIASSSEAMRVLELFEVQSQEGPCLDCYRTGEPVVNDDLTVGSRWPRFAPEAVASGFRAANALPMRLRGAVIGALNLFHVEAAGMTASDMHSAQALADVATIGILQHRAAVEAQALNDQLNQALNSRIAIEQAKGIISERLSIEMDQAFRILRQHARSRNQRLAEVARQVTDGSLPASDLDAVPIKQTEVGSDAPSRPQPRDP